MMNTRRPLPDHFQLPQRGAMVQREGVSVTVASTAATSTGAIMSASSLVNAPHYGRGHMPCPDDHAITPIVVDARRWMQQRKINATEFHVPWNVGNQGKSGLLKGAQRGNTSIDSISSLRVNLPTGPATGRTYLRIPVGTVKAWTGESSWLCAGLEAAIP
jgi:hypothetical protein